MIIGIGHINMINHAGIVGNVAFSYYFFSILKDSMKGQGTITRRIDLTGCMEKFRQQLHGIIGRALHL